MNLKQTPLALVFVFALGLLAAGCAQDTPSAPPSTSDATTMEQTDQASTDTAVAVDGHDHHHHAHDTAHAAGADFPVPDNHVQWEPDAPLIEGMSRVRAAIGGLEQASDEAAILTGANEVDAAIEYMFENCNLPVEPDIALHAVLARLMAGAQALQADPTDPTPVHDMHGAVVNYEALFADPNEGPGW
ncbi:MAG: hypothetical protein WCZ65_02240 [Lysobacteraceae bacterium]